LILNVFYHKIVKLWRYEDFVDVEVRGQVEEVAAVEDDEVDHTGYVKIGGVLRGREPQWGTNKFDDE
jgi:hypothetical protein